LRGTDFMVRWAPCRTRAVPLAVPAEPSDTKAEAMLTRLTPDVQAATACSVSGTRAVGSRDTNYHAMAMQDRGGERCVPRRWRVRALTTSAPTASAVHHIAQGTEGLDGGTDGAAQAPIAPTMTLVRIASGLSIPES